METGAAPSEMGGGPGVDSGPACELSLQVRLMQVVSLRRGIEWVRNKLSVPAVHTSQHSVHLQRISQLLINKAALLTRKLRNRAVKHIAQYLPSTCRMSQKQEGKKNKAKQNTTLGGFHTPSRPIPRPQKTPAERNSRPGTVLILAANTPPSVRLHERTFSKPPQGAPRGL